MTPIRSRIFSHLAAFMLASLFLVAWPSTARASLIPVNTTAIDVIDDDLCSLTEAIVAANYNSTGLNDDCVEGDDNPLDTIVLASGETYVTSGSFSNNGGGLNAYPTITSTVVISGNNSIIERSASEASPDLTRFFFIQQTTGDLTLHNLTLTNGKNTGHAGAILVEGTLSLVESLLISNTAGSSGGAIYNRGGSVALVDSLVLSNTAASSGGAIFNPGGSVTLVSSRFEHNQADFGGALAGTISGTITLSDTTLYSNTAEQSGGGIYNTEASIVTLTNSYIEENQASEGGGVNNTEGGTLNLSDSVITANRAPFGAGINNSSTGTVTVTNTQILTNVATSNGGGIFNNNLALLSITDSRFEGNSAMTGGGIYNGAASTTTVTSTYISNSVSASGGGIFNDNSNVEVINSHLLSNSALGSGGGLFASGGMAVITGTEIAGNRADTGGGLHLSFGTLEVRNSRLLNNVADSGGGAVAYSADTLNIDQSCIVGNSYLALYPIFPLTPDASDNWWGAPDGPSGAGTGAGDGVDAGVDFSNFLTTPILGCPTLTAQVELTKVADPAGDVLPFQPLTYTVMITNTGAEVVYNIVVVDALPTGYIYQSGFTTGPTINQSGDNFTIPVLAPAEVVTIVRKGIPDGTIVNDITLTNTATISHALAGQLQASVANNVIVPKFFWSSPTYAAAEGDAGSTLQVELKLDPPTPYIQTMVRTVITTSNGTSLENIFFDLNESSRLIDLDAARDGVIGPRTIELGLENFGSSAPGIPATATVTLTDTDSLGLEISQQVNTREAFLNRDTLTYTYQVTNTGTVNLSLEGYDDLNGSIDDFIRSISPQTTISGTRNIYLDEEEYQTGDLVNTFVVTGTDSALTALGRRETVTVSVGITGVAEVTLEIVPSTLQATVGDLITYTYFIENIGTLDLENVEIEDPVLRGSFGFGTLSAGQSATPSRTYTVKLADYPGLFMNTATLTGTSELGEIVTVTATASVNIVGEPELALSVHPSVSEASLGEVITYTLRVTNTGNLPITEIVIDDDAFGERFDVGTLLPDEIASRSFTHTVVLEDFPGPLDNEAGVFGKEPAGGGVGINASASVALRAVTGLEVTILPSASEIRVGEIITYTYVFTNTGTAALDNVVLEERAFDETFAVGTLPLNTSASRTLGHLVQSNDLPGPLVSHVVLTGTTPLDELVTITATVTVPILPYDTSLPFIERQ